MMINYKYYFLNIFVVIIIFYKYYDILILIREITKYISNLDIIHFKIKSCYINGNIQEKEKGLIYHIFFKNIIYK